MSQIAQQDHLYIEIADYGSLTDAEEAQILSAYKRNVLDDVIIVSAGGHSKILYWYLDDPDTPTSLNVGAVITSENIEFNITL